MYLIKIISGTLKLDLIFRVCITSALRCDGRLNCDGDESNCTNRQQTSLDSKKPHTEFFVEYTSFASSQIMLVGFFAMNVVFIGFFILLSLCSSSSTLARMVFRARKNRRSAYAQFIRQNGKDQVPSQKLEVVGKANEEVRAESSFRRSPMSSPRSPRSPRYSPKTNRQAAHRQSLIALLTIQPMLREDEPENEDSYLPYLPTLPSPSLIKPQRKISMPELNPVPPKLLAKRQSLQPASQAFMAQKMNKYAE